MTQKRTLDLDKVLAKATELLETRGLNETTMPNLAKALGVRSQSLYHYVNNRSQLLSLVAVSRVRVLYEDLIKQLVGLSGREALFKFADIVRDHLLKDKALSILFYQLNEFSNDSDLIQEVKKVLELGDKLPADKKPAIEAALQKLKDAHKSGDVAAIDAAIAELNAAWQAASAQMYQQGAQAGPQAGPQPGADQQGGAQPNQGKDDIQDADFEEVK